MRISDWSSDVCSSDLVRAEGAARIVRPAPHGRGNQLIIDRRRLPDKIAHIAHDFGDPRRRMRDRQCWRRQQVMVLTGHVVSVPQNRRNGNAKDWNIYVELKSIGCGKWVVVSVDLGDGLYFKKKKIKQQKDN